MASLCWMKLQHWRTTLLSVKLIRTLRLRMVLYKFTMLSSAWQRLTLGRVRQVIPVRYHESVKLLDGGSEFATNGSCACGAPPSMKKGTMATGRSNGKD